MNNITFNNFKLAENASNLAADKKSEESNEDFSAILTNIVTVLQNSNSTVQNVDPQIEPVKSQQTQSILSAGLPINNQTLNENNLLEIPTYDSSEKITFLLDKSPEQPNLNDLWAGFPKRGQQRIDDKEFDSMVKEKLKIEINNLFRPKENTTSQLAEPIEIGTELFEIKDVILFDPVEKTSVLENFNQIKTETTDFIEQNPQTYQSEIPDEIPVKNSELFAESNINAPIKAEPVAELKSGDTKNVSNNLPKTDSQSTLFQAEINLPIKTVLRKEEKPLPTNPSPQTAQIKLNPSLITKIKLEDSSILEPGIEYVYDSQSVSSTDLDLQIPQIKPLPQFENAKSENIKLTPSDVTTILKSFDNFLSNSEEMIKTENVGVAKEFEFHTDAAEIKEADSENFFSIDKFLGNISKENNLSTKIHAFENPQIEITEQISPHLLELAAIVNKKQEKQSLKLRLHPAELGSVEVTVERNHNGTLNAFFQTDSESAKQFLGQNIEQLRSDLQSAGWKVGQMEITYGSNSQTSHQQHQHQQENTARQSVPVENFNFSRSTDSPDSTTTKQQNRLLSLLA